MPLSKEIKNIIALAFKEDSVARDVTTNLSIAKSKKIKAEIIAKQKGVLCGVEIAKAVFKQIDKSLTFRALLRDGAQFKKGQTVAVISGKATNILRAERVALNFLSLLSATSTLTAEFVKKIGSRKVKLLDTRKTIPNLRQLQRYAVVMGGGYNHRRCLASGILIKDNHLKAGNYLVKGKLDFAKLDRLIRVFRRKTKLKLEVEVENLSEFKGLVKYKPDIIMLDNFSLPNLKKAVSYRNKYYPTVKLEASGGVNLASLAKIANCGLDFISVGALTHSASGIDFSLEIK